MLKYQGKNQVLANGMVQLKVNIQRDITIFKDTIVFPSIILTNEWAFKPYLKASLGYSFNFGNEALNIQMELNMKTSLQIQI